MIKQQFKSAHGKRYRGIAILGRMPRDTRAGGGSVAKISTSRSKSTTAFEHDRFEDGGLLSLSMVAGGGLAFCKT